MEVAIIGNITLNEINHSRNLIQSCTFDGCGFGEFIKHPHISKANLSSISAVTSIILPDRPLEDAVDLAPVHDERGQVRRHHRVTSRRRARQEGARVEHGAGRQGQSSRLKVAMSSHNVTWQGIKSWPNCSVLSVLYSLYL